MQPHLIFYSQCLFSYLCYNHIVVFHSVHTSPGFSLGSVCWAPIIRLIGRLWWDLIGRSVSVKCVVYTWTEDSLISCTVKRFVRVHSTRTEDTKTESDRTLNRMWPAHRHIRYRKSCAFVAYKLIPIYCKRIIGCVISASRTLHTHRSHKVAGMV